MKRMFVDHAGRVQAAEVKHEEAVAIVQYWVCAVILTVGCFLACCVAAGLI